MQASTTPHKQWQLQQSIRCYNNLKQWQDLEEMFINSLSMHRWIGQAITRRSILNDWVVSKEFFWEIPKYSWISMMKEVAIGSVLIVKSWKIRHYNLLIAWIEDMKGRIRVMDIDNWLKLDKVETYAGLFFYFFTPAIVFFSINTFS
jgi:hypothetical protein